ncbi:MAG: hypothetical protein KKA62_03920 [Nanoarchaeota archaeon]|nr:hypothetical protein [Nanoarchaeota archaeon]MBU1644663.1 hypothetical protein [Nanoarchaeota archaeon]MBU1977072.1 hypothetical protein [Nanoarchaeota archaeon]
MTMEMIDERTIKLERRLNNLDRIVLKFVKILEKHTDYVLISGYVAILLGRTRGTEDVDFFINKLSKEQFSSFYKDLLDNGFWAINADDVEELYSMLKDDRLAVRFAERGNVAPNMEVKFVKDALDELAMKEKIKVITEEGKLFISRIDLQIAYKKFVLASYKDLEDARHLQKLFDIKDETINKYKILFEQYGRI